MKNPVVALCAVLMVSPFASAQVPAPAQPRAGGSNEPVVIEAVTVTGSNLRRVDAETALPVTVIDPAELNARGAATMAELFETLGVAEPSAITEINNGPQLARGDVASIDLRGLGSGSTLTLVNGRRMAPHPISMAENGVPSLATNINAIPRAMISKVEILRDGASAIYGSDAAAGVINNYVSSTYEGRDVRFRASATARGGAAETGVTLAEGFRFGKTHLAVSVDYFHRDALAASQRYWASNSDQRLSRTLPAPWSGQPLTLPDGSVVRDNDFANTNSVNQWGQWQRGFIQSDYLTFVGSRPDANRGISTSTTPPSGVATMATTGMFYLWPEPSGAVSFKQSAPSKNIDSAENATYANWNRWKILVPATDRFQLGAFLDRPISDRLTLFGDVLFYSAYSRNGREPVNFKNTDDQGVYLPAANPWNPFGVRFYHPTGSPNADGTPRLVGTPADVSLWTGISPGQNAAGPVGFRPRVTEVWSYSYRLLGGLRGRLANGWEWESGLLASGAQTHEYEHFQIRESRLRAALNRTDALAFNPFPVTFKITDGQIAVDKLYYNPATVLELLYDDEDRFGRTNLFLWDARLNGRVGRLYRGGQVGIATGAEVRYETYDDKRAAYSGVNPPGSGSQFPLLREGDNDFLALSSNLPISARQTIFATYAEVALPFVTRQNRLPLVEALELSLAGRFEHFSIFGQTTKPKAGLVWHPARWFKVRGSLSESFRAPNLVQTNITPLKRQISASDPYRYEVTALASDGTAQRTTYRQGNQNLRPEEAQTTSGGVVIEVPGIRGLSVTFDYFKINQNSVIENIGAGATLLRDELLLDLATQAALAAGTPIDKIDLGSGTAAYKGSNKIVRKTVTDADRAAYAAFNARQTSNAARRAPVGEFVSAIDDYINLSGRDIQGYDFGVQYRIPRNRLGQFTLAGDATHYVLRRSQADPESPTFNELEMNGRVKWRASASLSWRRNGWSAGWFTNYFGSFVDTSAATTEAVYRALGGPSYIRVYNNNGITQYLLRVDPTIYSNAWVGYTFGRTGSDWTRGVTVRLGVNNVSDREPPISDESLGFQGGTVNLRGRQYTLDIRKAF